MTVSNKQEEVFIINDINMEINPSDIQVMDDNWVIEESYLRSKAVFCYRSQYAATKVVLNIPFQISHLNEGEQSTLNNTYNCIKLVSELNAYPFCFIKNNRIRAYISPTNISSTDFMMFAVDEVALVQDAKASNMVFLEVVLQYFNHVPLIKDFEFRGNLSVGLTNKEIVEDSDANSTSKATKRVKTTLVRDLPPDIVDTLESSAIWKKFMDPQVKKVFELLTDTGLLDVMNTDDSKHPMMGVKLLAPLMSEINFGMQNVDDGRYVGPNTKVITTTDNSSDNGSFENMLNTIYSQDFSGDAKYEKDSRGIDSINTEKSIKDGNLTTKASRGSLRPDVEANSGIIDGKVSDPFVANGEPIPKNTATIKWVDKANSLSDAVNNQTYKNNSNDNLNNNKQETRDPNLPMASKDIFIQWTGKDFESLAMGVQTIEIRRKNKLASHQISAFKHPIIQYMGKYPVSMSITMASVNHDIYKTDEYPTNTFIKQVLNILDYNRSLHPEAEAYNYLEVKSLASSLMGVTSYLPSQSMVAASSSSQGLEHIQYTFNESNLTSFIEETTVEASGKLSLSKGNEKINGMIVQWLVKFPITLQKIIDGTSKVDPAVALNSLEIYKMIMNLSKEALKELGMEASNHIKGVETAISLSGDLKPNNNVARKFTKLDTSVPKQLSQFSLYQEASELNRTKADDAVYGPFNWAIMNKGTAPKKEEQPKPTFVTVKTDKLHYELISFMASILTTRNVLIAGGSSDIPNLAFRPGGTYNNLAMGILAKMEVGLSAGDPDITSIISTKEDKEFLQELTNNYANAFTGYNLEDLELERLSPIKYDKATDILIPEIDPFFFLVEKYNLDGNELSEVYNNLYADQGDSQSLINQMNNDENDIKDEADATAKSLGVTYRKLKEINYDGPLVSSNDYSAYHNVMSGAPTAVTTDEQNAMILKLYNILLKKGLSPNQARILLAEIGRENSFNYNTIYGFHSDPKRGYNIGMISWQGPRFQPLVDRLNAKGLLNGGVMSRTDATLEVQIDYILYEINNLSIYSPTKKLFLGDKNVSYSVGTRVLGTNYIAWAYGESAFSSGHQNRDAFYKRVLDVTKGNTEGPVTALIRDTATSLLEQVKNNPKVGMGVLKNQKQTVDNASKAYAGIVKSAADKTTQMTTGVTAKGRVIRVKDGDTFEFLETRTGKVSTIRVFGINTPEISHDKSESGEIMGESAKRALIELINGKDVTVQVNGTDSFKEARAIGRVILKDGTDVSLTMIRNGYAFVEPQYISVGAYNKALSEAKSKQAGIWSYPAGSITKPAAKQQADLSSKDAEKLKNNINYQKFSQDDLTMASKANGVPLNSYQPFEGGKTFKVKSEFGMRLHPIHKDYRMHNGVDLGCTTGTRVVAAASGQVTTRNDPKGYGYYIEINHGNGFVTLYAHLSKYLVANNAYVNAGDAIALSGNTGSSTGPHLHYGVKYNGKFINPFGTKQLTLYKPGDSVGTGINTTVPMNPLSEDFPLVVMNRSGVTEFNTVFNEDELAREIFRRMYKYTNVGLKAALPCLKVYVTVGNENDKFWLDTLKGGVQYYEVKGIKNFHMNCNNNSNPIDTVIMTIANPSFLNTDSFAGLSKMQGINYDKIGTDLETQYINDRLQIKVGTKLHIRSGYGSNPNDLEIIFNGTVASVDNTTPQALQLVCESYGKELLSELLSTNEPKFLNDQNDNISTSSIIGESLVSRVVEHFGYNSGFWADKFRSSTDPEDRALSPNKLSFSYNYFYDLTKASYKSRLFMNVFGPEIEKLDDEFNGYIGWISNLGALFSNHKGGYPFAVYRMTPWDCIKQMEYRHPNTIAKPIMYEDRVSLFYGIKEQTCFTKDLSRYLQSNAATEKDSLKGDGISTVAYADRRRERMSPAVGVHLVTSNHNLISNGMVLNNKYSTVTNVNYYVKEEASLAAKPWELKLMKMQSDDNLYPFDLREKDLTLSGCIGRYNAFLYGTTDLKKEAEKMYSGKILILGNPSIKAGDYIFLDDSEKKIHGMLLVRECYHHYDDNNGLVTEIVPGQYVEAANFLYSSLWLRLMCCSKIVTSKLKINIAENYSAEDFNMVTDYLTIMNQIEVALDKFDKSDVNDQLGYAMAVGSVTTLSLVLMNSLYRTLGLRDKRFNLLTGGVRFTKHFFIIYTHSIDKVFLSIAKTAGISYLTSKTTNVRAKISATKTIIGGSKFGEYVKNSKIVKMKSGIAWRTGASALRFGTRASMTAASIVSRVMASTILAITFSNPFTILLDILAMYAVSWAFNKMEEIKLTRQPLLFFPVIKHGKAYTGGMAGIMRNSWGASQKLEASRTTDQIRKSAEIISTNADVQGRNNVLNTILKGISNGYGDSKKSMPLYETDKLGNQYVVNNNRVVTKLEDDKLKAEEERRKQSLVNKNTNEAIVKNELKTKGFEYGLQL